MLQYNSNFGRAARLRGRAGQLKGNPSFFYGAPIDVEPEDVAEALVSTANSNAVVPAAIVKNQDDDMSAAQRLADYEAMSISDRANVTNLPVLATWNATVTVNPNLGKILAFNLNWQLTKAMVDYPYEGRVVQSAAVSNKKAIVTLSKTSISADLEPGVKSVPLFRFTLAASNLQAAAGGNYSIVLRWYRKSDASPDPVLVAQTDPYSFQRLETATAVYGIFIPYTVVATRTLPILPLFGRAVGEAYEYYVEIELSGAADTDQFTVTVPGYATQELKQIAMMYNLPAGLVK